ncbi:Fc.00g043560.m01.CDS01 [Cosmosporella sp. VM-42]
MLGTHQAAHDLLDKRSSIYSSRPRTPMGAECVSKGLRSLLMPYGQQWRNHQRLQGSFLNIRTSATYRTLQDVESKQLIFEMLSTDEFSDRYHRYSSSLIYALAYGRRMTQGNEPEVQAIDQVMDDFLYAARVGTWIVDSIPALNILPTWLAPWKKYGDKLHQFEAEFYMKNMLAAQQTPSWNWSKQVQNMKEGAAMPKLELAYDVGIVYEAGSDTTTMALEVFTMAIILYPDVAREGQKELDCIVGRERLPTFEDQASLPYVNAILKEVLRWRPVSAGGIPHAVTQDDEYMGYHIPKGATVIGNHWGIHLDDTVYRDPYEFRPSRWIENPDLPASPFGFGRRVCTGQHIARNSLFINISRLLWSFDISYAYDENGVKQEIDPFNMTQGFNSRPMPFKASFKVRDKDTESVVRKEWAAAEKDVNVILDSIRRG